MTEPAAPGVGGAFAARIERIVVDGWFRDPPPFLRAMATSPTVAVARAFVLEWTKFSRWFPRWVGAVMSNCPEFDVLAFEVENLTSEVVRDPQAGTNHYELLVRLGAGAGLDRATIESHQPSAQSGRAFAYWDRMARQPDWLLGFTALNGLELLGDRSIPRRHGVGHGTGLDPDPWAASGIPADALEFFRVSDDADAAHGNATLAILDRHTPVPRRDDVVGVLNETMGYLRTMMDGLWELTGRVEEEVGQ
ncbi:MAG TPA: iron-containing redox enzyme family protein [Acidimicrobiales bacterium]|nr:iron-containing redox enzyme family protein [Acidimicrobiales bacterium]